jgi:hypothetical protein
MCHARSPTRRFEQLLEIYLSRKRRVYCPWPRHDSMSTTMIPLHAHNHGQRITASCLPMDTTIYYSQDIQEHTCGMFSSLPGSRNFFPYSAFQSSKGDLPNQDPLQLARLHFWKGVLVPVHYYVRKNVHVRMRSRITNTWPSSNVPHHCIIHRCINMLVLSNILRWLMYFIMYSFLRN